MYLVLDLLVHLRVNLARRRATEWVWLSARRRRRTRRIRRRRSLGQIEPGARRGLAATAAASGCWSGT